MSQDRDALGFGPFQLVVAERLLARDGRPVALGGWALDLLIALASAPNQTLGKAELMERVWPNIIADEGSLRFHMAKLREALGDGVKDTRYIATLPGQGYRFVAPVSRAGRRAPHRARLRRSATRSAAGRRPPGSAIIGRRRR